jgi:hypothetical protein
MKFCKEFSALEYEFYLNPEQADPVRPWCKDTLPELGSSVA